MQKYKIKLIFAKTILYGLHLFLRCWGEGIFTFFTLDFLFIARRKLSNSEELLSSFINIHVPKEYLDHFDVVEIKNKPDCYEIILHEKEDHIPLELHSKKITFDGFCNPTNILTHTFSLKHFF